MVAVAGEGEARQPLAPALNTLHPLQVTNAVLRHRSFPLIDPGKERLSSEAYNLLQFLADDVEDFVIRELEDLFIPRATEKTAHEGTILGSAVRKLIVYKSRRQHAFAFTTRHQETEARRQ